MLMLHMILSVYIYIYMLTWATCQDLSGFLGKDLLSFLFRPSKNFLIKISILPEVYIHSPRCTSKPPCLPLVFVVFPHYLLVTPEWFACIIDFWISILEILFFFNDFLNINKLNKLKCRFKLKISVKSMLKADQIQAIHLL